MLNFLKSPQHLNQLICRDFFLICTVYTPTPPQKKNALLRSYLVIDLLRLHYFDSL